VHTLSVSAMRHEVVYTEKFAVHLDRSSFELDDLDPVSIDMAFNEWLHGMGLFIDTPNGAVYFGQPGPRHGRIDSDENFREAFSLTRYIAQPPRARDQRGFSLSISHTPEYGHSVNLKSYSWAVKRQYSELENSTHHPSPFYTNMNAPWMAKRREGLKLIIAINGTVNDYVMSYNESDIDLDTVAIVAEIQSALNEAFPFVDITVAERQ